MRDFIIKDRFYSQVEAFHLLASPGNSAHKNYEHNQRQKAVRTKSSIHRNEFDLLSSMQTKLPLQLCRGQMHHNSPCSQSMVLVPRTVRGFLQVQYWFWSPSHALRWAQLYLASISQSQRGNVSWSNGWPQQAGIRKSTGNLSFEKSNAVENQTEQICW